MINKIQIILIVLIIPLCALYFYSQSKGITIRDIFLPGIPTMHIGEIPLRVEVVNTDEERAKGLSERTSLENIDGMLFVFPKSDFHKIWMKDMNFPIDIIWIDEELTVINIEKNVSPSSYPKVYKPLKPALYAVESKVDFADVFGLHDGLKVRMPLKYLED